MLNLTRLITLRSIRTRLLRTLFSTFGVVLGVAGMFSIGATNQAAFNSISNLFQGTSGRVDLEIHSADNTGEFGESLIDQVAVVPGVASAVPLVRLQAALEGDQQESVALSFFGASSGGLLLYGIDPALDPTVRDYSLTAGRFLSNDLDAYEIVLVDSYAEEEELEVGKRVMLRTPGGPVRLKVVGLIAKKGPGENNLGSFGVIPIQTAQNLKYSDEKIDQIDLLVDEELTDPDSLEMLRYSLQDRLGEQYTVLYPANQGQRMAQMLSGYQVGLNFMGGIALFVGAFLIYNAFSMTVIERTREFGLLRSIGLTREQVIGQVLVEGFLLGGFGSVAGALLGLAMTRGLVQVMAQILGQPLDAGAVPPSVLVSSMVIGLVVTVLSALLPALQAGKISPLEALRLRGRSQGDGLLRWGWPVGLAFLALSTMVLVWNPFPYDVQFRMGSMTVFGLFFGAMLLIPISIRAWERVARLPFQWIYGSSGQIGTRNLERARLRTMLTSAALLVGVSMIVVIQGMTYAFSADLKAWMQAYIGGDLYVNSSVPMRSDLQMRLEALDSVDAAAPIRYFEVTWLVSGQAEEKLNFMAIDPDAYTRVTRFVFDDPETDVVRAVSALERGGSVFISSVMAEKYGLVEGDILYFKARSGLRPFEVAGIVMDFYNQGMVVTGSWADMRRHFRLDDATMMLVKVQESYPVEQTRDQIDKLYGKRYQLTLESNQSLKERALGLMDQAFSMFDVLGIIAVMVAALGVVNTLTMSVIERTREIGMLRSIGMTRWQVIKMVLAEAGLLGIMGGLMGLIFGILLTRIFLASMTAMSGYSLDFVLPPQTVPTSVIVSLVVSQLAAMLPALRAARTPVLEAIHYE